MPPTLKLPKKIKIQQWMSDFEIHKINTMTAVDYILDWFQKRIPSRRGGVPIIKSTSASDRIMVLRSGTGSGKSTTLAPELYLKFDKATVKNIAVTQPRVLTAVSIPTDIEKFYVEMKMGKNLGYQTGSYVHIPDRGVVFMTDGVLAQQLKTMSDEQIMKKYSFIIIDECHVRSISMDLILSLIKQLIHRNYMSRECPFLILTSATFNVKKYADYFMVDHKNIIDVEGINYPIDVNYHNIPASNYIKAAVEKAIKLHNNMDDYKDNNKFVDILIFVYGARPMREIRKILHEKNEDNKNNNYYVLIGLDRMAYSTGNIDYQNVFKPLSSINVVLTNGDIVIPRRRIIVSTNIAETGVTIDTLKYLIDTGFENSALFNPNFGSFSVIPKNITRASAVQRKGRVGRRAPGSWHPLYTKESFEKMPDDIHPQILTVDISSALLSIIIKYVYPEWDGSISDDFVPVRQFSIHSIDFLDYPSFDNISHSLEKLYVLGMVDCDLTPTVFGLIASNIIKIDIESVRMILAGYQNGANIMDLITIASFMFIGKRNYKDGRSRNKYKYTSLFEKSDKEIDYYNKFFVADDFIETIFIWNDLMDQIKIMRKKLSIYHIKQWSENNGLLYSGLLSVVDHRDSLISSFIQGIGLDPSYNGLGIKKDKYDLRKIMRTNFHGGLQEIKKIKKCIYEGFRLNTATWNDEKSSYILDRINLKIRIRSDVVQPLSSHESFLQTRPKKIIVKNVVLRENPRTKIFQFESDTAGVLDGYVNIDNMFFAS